MDTIVSSNKRRAHRKYHAVLLAVLLALFIFRVVAQFIQANNPVSFLPPFHEWQSGALPYPLLIVFQLIIIIFYGQIVWKFYAGTVHPSPKAGAIYLVLGGIYFSIMAFRLVAGFSFASEHPWFGAHIPAVFHLVLASFLLSVGFFHSQHTRSIIKWVAYPLIMLAALTSHRLLISNTVDLQIATYVPVVFGALAIIVLELSFPHKKEWHFTGTDVRNDSTYMLVVQILLPRFLSFFIVISMIDYLHTQNITIDTIWPHNWHIVAQVITVMVIAEFMRYWLHRLAHNWTWLWKLHSVHHSPHKLYSINVGRFHPIEKSLQYLLDTLPFIIFGLSPEVLALYFVFYALNGFFQHSNMEIRLGILNYIISGPELHRWHHSYLISQSNNNYGNNLIIWDLLFKTWYLPKNKSVAKLGLKDHNFPTDFIGQLKAPFASTRSNQ